MTQTVTANPDPDTSQSGSPDPAPIGEAVASRIDWWGEVKGIFWLLLAVLGFHSFIA